MKLTHIRIKDFRSFAGEHEFEMASGVNYFVGPNNCGKSNLVRAIELALDPDAKYSSDLDRPAKYSGVGKPPTTRITLTFKVGTSSPERTLLSRAETYELGVRMNRKASTSRKVQTYAAEREIKLVTSFTGSGGRQTTFQAKGLGASSLPVDSREHEQLETQFRSVVRFGVIHSGENLESLLKGKFRDILNLVIADHLSDALDKARVARQDYLTALQNELLDPLRQRVLAQVAETFPEITVADLVPAVPTVEQTLSSVDVQLGDAITTQLTDKGTGIRGAVLISMLQYMAEQSRRSLVLAVEEPEAFLHPAAQESTGQHLDALAKRPEVSLLVTTHSPYVITRSVDAQITELRKGADGVTAIAASAKGDGGRADLLGSLYRDAGLARILERALEIPAGTRVVVVTEGYTDGFFVKAVCKAVGSSGLLEGVHFIPAGKAAKVVVQSVLAEASTDAPVVALLDFDENGRAAADKLKSFGWEPSKRLLSLSSWPNACKNHDIEIEDLLPKAAVRTLIDRLGDDLALDSKEKCGTGWHYRVSIPWKEAAIESLASGLPRADPGGMVWLAEEITRRESAIRRGRQAARDHLAGLVRSN